MDMFVLNVPIYTSIKKGSTIESASGSTIVSTTGPETGSDNDQSDDVAASISDEEFAEN
ncbi:hypothetical protein ISN44_As03g029150 [Arabidopsis suecica]|uniref:Uncharacterized protein n=1 Tax=Arabidopsis suecica TaxID=45249 RepID=A0A8T2FFC1_ARASU|nr:hypothetical protein ISN44_As03g029150 [Arabidopsis suecica]